MRAAKAYFYLSMTPTLKRPLAKLGLSIERVSTTVAGVLVVSALAALWLSQNIRFAEPRPAHAHMVVDYGRGVYLSPPCFDRLPDDAFTHQLEYVSWNDIADSGFQPHPACRADELAGGEGWSLGWELGARAGLLDRPSRWNRDGSWRW
jgi:hypothetical protein